MYRGTEFTCSICWVRSPMLREVFDFLFLCVWQCVVEDCSYLQSCRTRTHPDYQRGSKSMSSSVQRGGGEVGIKYAFKSWIDGHFWEKCTKVWRQDSKWGGVNFYLQFYWIAKWSGKSAQLKNQKDFNHITDVILSTPGGIKFYRKESISI